MNKLTCLDFVRKYIPGISDEYADFILWEKTCFPMGDKETIEKQIKEFAKTLRGES